MESSRGEKEEGERAEEGRKMGRRKVEMKLIEDKGSRQVTFSRRRYGLMKKAREISVLCDVPLALVVFSRSGRLYEFSNGESLARMVKRYQDQLQESPEASTDVDAENHSSKFSKLLSHVELLEIVESQLESPNIEQLSINDLVHLEKQLEMALSVTRAREMELMMKMSSNLRQTENLLSEENQNLRKKYQHQTKNKQQQCDPDLGPTLGMNLLSLREP